jgi:hypothetical protein
VLSDLGKTDQAVAEARKLLGGKNDREVYLSLADIYEKPRTSPRWPRLLDAAEKLSVTSEEKQTSPSGAAPCMSA